MKNADYPEIIKSILRSIEDQPEAWRSDKDSFFHDKSGIRFRIGRLFAEAKLCNTRLHLSLASRLKIWLAYREWKKREISLRLKGDIDMLPAPDEVTMEFAGNPYLTD